MIDFRGELKGFKERRFAIAHFGFALARCSVGDYKSPLLEALKPRFRIILYSGEPYFGYLPLQCAFTLDGMRFYFIFPLCLRAFV